MVNLEQLQQEIATIGETIKTLKGSNPVDKNAVASAIALLLEAKKTYAVNNNGIGSDGQPFEEQLSKAQKKAKAKADVDQATSAAKQVCGNE